MGLISRLFGGKHDDGKPFLEHPTGDFENALAAMEDAVRRLRSLRRWENWITFNAQGQGGGPDQYQFADIRMLGDRLDVGDRALDVGRIIQVSRTTASSLLAAGEHYSVASASPQEVAQILDAIFREHFGIRPFADEDNDYAVGAEW